MKDIYGNEYELYSGKVYISKNREFGNVAVNTPKGLNVIKYGKLDKSSIENAILAMGYRLEDFL